MVIPDSLASSSKRSSPIQIDHAICNGLEFEFQKCRGTMKDICTSAQPYILSLSGTGSENRLLDIRRKIPWDRNGHKTKPQLEDLDAHVRALQIFTDVIVLCVAPHFL